MNALTQPQARALADAFLRPTRKVTAHDLCNSIRNLEVLNHDELSQVLAVFADYVKGAAHGMTQPCTDYVVSHLDDICGRIDRDLAEQQAEAAWEARK